MRNYIQPGDNLTLNAPAAVISGQGVQIGDLFGVANGDASTRPPWSSALPGCLNSLRRSPMW